MTKFTLVLLPGMDGTGELFAPLIASLGGGFEVRVVSYPRGEALDYAALERLVRAALPSDGAFALVAESFSGPIAVSIAASGIANLKALVLCCTFVRNPRPALSVFRNIVDKLPIRIPPSALLDALFFGGSFAPKLRQTLTLALQNVSPAALRARLKAVLAVDVATQLVTIKIPVLYLRACRDRVVPKDCAAEILKLRPSTHIIEIDGPHFLLQVAPDATANAMTIFLRDTRAC